MDPHNQVRSSTAVEASWATLCLGHRKPDSVDWTLWLFNDSAMLVCLLCVHLFLFRKPTSQMSKSAPLERSRIHLTDTDDQIRKKVCACVVGTSVSNRL